MNTKPSFLEIKVKNSSNKEVSLSDLLGKFVVLYFYPKDFTPGCTTEACAFRDANDDLKDLGVVVVGVSKDSPESHQKFLDHHHLNFELWSDENGELMTACGAIGEKTMFGKTLIGIKRITLILNQKGEVIKTYKAVKPESHAEQVLKFLRAEVAK
jgi:thioredoxin-dependent peroxiredoxin